MKSSLQPGTLIFSTFLLFLYSMTSYADITIGLFLDKQTHFVSDAAPTLSVTAVNPDPAIAKDVHLGIISPNGTIYEYPNWNTNLQPWLPSFTVPANFQLGNTVITNFNDIPGGLTAGIWQAFFALTEPGSTSNITHLQLVGLNVIDPNMSNVIGTGSRYGSITINRIQAINQTIVTASGAFYEADTQFPNLVNALQGEEPVIDQCTFNQTQSTQGVGSSNEFTITSLDAGDLTITGSEALPMTKQINPPNIIYTATPSISFFDNAGSFNFSGSGGPGIGAFNVTVPTTNSINLLSPSGNNFSIASGQDLALNWTNNNNGAGEVLVSLSGIFVDIANPDSTEVYTIACRFIDDGSAIISGDLIAQLQQALPVSQGFQLPGNLPIDIPIDLPIDLPIDIPGLNGSLILAVSRVNYKFFTSADPELDIGIATVLSGVSFTGGFQ